MAEESQDGQEKTEEPTSRKLEKAAEEGSSTFLKRNVCVYRHYYDVWFCLYDTVFFSDASFILGYVF